jgi:hypothetical protein
VIAPHTKLDGSSTAPQSPRLLEKLRHKALERGYGEDVANSHVDWCRRFILFHRKRHPREMGVGEVGQFLAHVAKVESEPLCAIAASRAALEFLYDDVLVIGLGELPWPRPPKLLDQVRHVARLRHYSRRTEECYVAWIERYIHFHGLRHPREMGTTHVGTFLTHLAAEGQG